ncbi:hypothetical protein B7463_g7412, partial [Scytalidium lignicola]
MRPVCLLIRRPGVFIRRVTERRNLLTLAIETSCDDTSVAVLEKRQNNSATLHYHSKITSDNRSWEGVHPILSHVSHQKNLAKLVNDAVSSLPILPLGSEQSTNCVAISNGIHTQCRQKPDFITVTRGPGMRASLITGIDTAKGLSVAWQIPILGVNHMQAHALTPRLISALEADINSRETQKLKPEFPFLSLLVSGGHTMLVQSKGLFDHKILATTTDLALGVVVDKCARNILPTNILESASNVMYGGVLERFAYPEANLGYDYTPPRTRKEELTMKDTGYGWTIRPPLSQAPEGFRGSEFSYSGIGSTVKRIMEGKPNMDVEERRALAHEVMRVSFEHLASRVLLALENPDIKGVKALVVSGGVASNQFLRHLLRAILDARGHPDLELMFPPPALCTDNAAMIAWTGIELWEAGWRSKLDMVALKKWSIDPHAEDGGILGVDGWNKVA